MPINTSYFIIITQGKKLITQSLLKFIQSIIVPVGKTTGTVILLCCPKTMKITILTRNDSFVFINVKDSFCNGIALFEIMA